MTCPACSSAPMPSRSSPPMSSQPPMPSQPESRRRRASAVPEEGFAPSSRRFKAVHRAVGPLRNESLRAESNCLGRAYEARLPPRVAAMPPASRRKVLDLGARPVLTRARGMTASPAGAVTGNRTRVSSVAHLGSAVELPPQERCASSLTHRSARRHSRIEARVVTHASSRAPDPLSDPRAGATRGTCTLLIPRYQ